MCDVCSDFLHLLDSYEARISMNDAKPHHAMLLKSEIDIAYTYIHVWPQRQCMCLYREAKNYDRFNYLVQSLIVLAVHNLKQIGLMIEDYKRLSAGASQIIQQQQQQQQQSPRFTSSGQGEKTEKSSKSDNEADKEDNVASKSGEGDKSSQLKENKDKAETNDGAEENRQQRESSSSPIPPAPSMQLNKTAQASCSSNKISISSHPEETWILPEIEKLLVLLSKVFLINFPLYIAYKHGTHARLDDISPEEAQHLAIFCDLHDNEMPVYLLRNISLFCTSGGFAAMILCFEQHDLPLTTAQALSSIIINIKIWLNYGCTMQLFVPLRNRVLQYMCRLSDACLRTTAMRSMADLVWGTIRDPLDSSVAFDVEGLALAFKYFTSSTLTMRLTGMAQINSHINLFNEICTTETVGEVEVVGQKIANWLTENKIIQHLFGPNLHVELIKQAHVVLNFLAVENKITEEHIKLIWQATQLKHCSKTIFDILTSLVKNLALRPAMHLYSLLCRMDPKDHTEQSIYIASALTKLIWSREVPRANLSMMQEHLALVNTTASSSDSATSMDASNSEDGICDDDSLNSGGRASGHRVRTGSRGVNVGAEASGTRTGAVTRKSTTDNENVDSSPTHKQQVRRRRETLTKEKTKKLTAAELNLLKSKADMKIQNHHRIVNIIDNSSSEDEEDLQVREIALQMHHHHHHHRKKTRKRRKNHPNNIPMTRLAHEIVEAIWEGGEDDEEDASSDDVEDVDGDIVNDDDDEDDESEECSDADVAEVPEAVLKHLQGEGPYIRAIAETNISELLSGGDENEGSYSSPMSNKSEKNLADFDDEDISPCEEELVQLVSSHARLQHGCMPPAFAAAAAAMAAAHSAIIAACGTSVENSLRTVAPMIKYRSAGGVAPLNVGTNAANVTKESSPVASVSKANDSAAGADSTAGSAHTTPRANTNSTSLNSSKRSDSDDVDVTDLSKESPKTNSSAASDAYGGAVVNVHQPTFRLNDVCQPGNTLLWDLLQDDKIYHLGEALASEAEKALATLLCFSMDRILRMKFIEGCLQNLAANRSVVVSLRLLPKLFASFQQFRQCDTHQVTMWAERTHKMMHHFFNNIKHYAKKYAAEQAMKSSNPPPPYGTTTTSIENTNTSNAEPPSMYTHKTQVSVRLHFLSSIYSNSGSPKSFRLSLEQVDALWDWLARDPECADCYFSWLQSQAKISDQHALCTETLNHLFLKKLPELRPEEFSMVALGLFQQLCGDSRTTFISRNINEKPTTGAGGNGSGNGNGSNANAVTVAGGSAGGNNSIGDSNVISTNFVGMSHLWKIALQAHNTDVSFAAIHYINMYYMKQQLRSEKEFVSQCMDNLVQAASILESEPNSEQSLKQSINALESIQRGLTLLTTHLEAFRRRYAFHLRRWAIEGKEYGYHSNLKNDSVGPTIRVIVQAAGLSEKNIIYMQTSDLIADLRAEISKRWEILQGITSSSSSTPVLGLLLSEGPLRIITQGQELTLDYDERTLGDAGFKDRQIVYVSLGGRGVRRKESHLDHPSMQPPPPKESLPTVLLLQTRYFEQLFRLIQILSNVKPHPNHPQLHTKGQILSRRVWDILSILPINPVLLDAFRSLADDWQACEQLTAEQKDLEASNKKKNIKQKLAELLDITNLQKFMYSLHIVESLASNTNYKNRNMPCNSNALVTGNSSAYLNRNANLIKSLTSGAGTSAASSVSAIEKRLNSGIQPQPQPRPLKEELKTAINDLNKDKDVLESLSPCKESDGSAIDVSDSLSGNDKENTPLKAQIRRTRKSESTSDVEKENAVSSANVNSTMSAVVKALNSNLSSPAASTATIVEITRQSLTSNAEPKWCEAFIKCGGLRHLYDILISGDLQKQHANPRELFNEWRHDSLASLLRIIWLFGFEELPSENKNLTVSRPKGFMLDIIDVESLLRCTTSILNAETYSHYVTHSMAPQFQYHQYIHLRTGYWGRAQVVQLAVNIILALVIGTKEARVLIWSKPDYCSWLKRLILEDPEPAVRREICAGLYRTCIAVPQQKHLVLAPLLRKLLSYLPTAEHMIINPQPPQFFLPEEGKDSYGLACRDYFWLLSGLVDKLTPDLIKTDSRSPQKIEDSQNPADGETIKELLDIESLCQSVAHSILTRDYYETRFGFQDDCLIGLLSLMTNLLKFDPKFKFSNSALELIDRIFEFLFDMPSPLDRNKPKCKSISARSGAYDVLLELCRKNPNNYASLHEKLLEQHSAGSKQQAYPWDYWPRDEGRAECGYVGLTNLGATCYMASCIQHLYMMPQARAAILNASATNSQKHGPTLVELQRMFAYLLESERKAYNPRSFCRVYQMDHQPLNTGEQKDMAEFFIDLVSKLEEMTPELKVLVKRLFCGTLSNNVVSLDCEHVSRTAEEFYTVRCQVADMRNLQESLDEVTVKDTLEGDNMYTCSQCGKKVRAEKRACFKKLPQILCFNTMRYTFNMITMLKEKVNTHFSFPMRLNMSDYVEKTLMPQQYAEDREKRKKELSETKKESEEKADGPEKDEGKSESEATDEKTEKEKSSTEFEAIDEDIEECLEYELVGVTVHTGTADGGHYYSFIKERKKAIAGMIGTSITGLSNSSSDRWFLFNDAEVKTFDPSQIAAECFGGEMTSKTYDSVTEKYLDFSFEKTNSAYMLFYERCLPEHLKQRQAELITMHNNNIKEKETKKSDDETTDNKSDSCDKGKLEATTSAAAAAATIAAIKFEDAQWPTIRLSKDLEDWIWKDNRQFLQDRNIFEHNYIAFMWQICNNMQVEMLTKADITYMAAKLSVSFFIETFIHAKEKPTMVHWVELLTKQFNASQEACEWFLQHMSIEPWWPVQVLIQCPNQMVRQMFQRLVIHVIQRLRSSHVHLYLKRFDGSKSNDDEEENDDDDDIDTDMNTSNGDKDKNQNRSSTKNKRIGNASCVTRFIKSLVSLMEHGGAKPHMRNLSEYFALLYDFSRMGEEETLFLIYINVIKTIVDFYLGNKALDNIEVGSDNDDNSSDEALSVDKALPASLEKMIALVASLVERSRGSDLRLRLPSIDYDAIAGGKGFPFLYQQIKDNINPQQTKNLILALCRWDDRLANQIISMLFVSLTKHTELSSPFFKLLSLLTETQGGTSGLPCFSQLILQRVWDAAEYCPQSALEWLANQAPKNKIAHSWILQSAENWVEQYLLSHNLSRVRNGAAFLLVSLVPSQQFRANFRSHNLHKLSALSNHVYRELNGDAQIILHHIITILLRLLRPARVYADLGMHGTAKLTAYFSLLSYCMISKKEKLMIGPYMRSLWDLFHPRLSEPSVPAHHNKHALLAFWHHTVVDCPENAQIIANCPEITRNIAFNYILADHEDSEIVAYNRAMLPAYYGLLRLCCEQSRALTRQLAAHQNLQWAFKNITPHPTQYSAAVDELFKLMSLFAERHPEASEQEKHEITTFRRTTLSAYLTGLDARVSWSTLINAFRILVDNDEDRLLIIYNGGIEMCFEALHTLHSMHHEATACHVAGDLQELLRELVLLLQTLRLSTRLDTNSPNASTSCQAQQQQQQQQQEEQSDHQKQSQIILEKEASVNKNHNESSNNKPQDSNTVQKQQQQQQQQKEKEKKSLQLQHQHLQLQIMQHQHFLRQQQQQQHTGGLVKGLPDAIKRLATLLNTYNPPEMCRLALDVLKELVRNANLDVTSILVPILINCHLTVASTPNAIGPLGPYFPRRGVKPASWSNANAKNIPRPPKPIVQMSIPRSELMPKGVDLEYDAQVEEFYRPYHDFIDILMRMAVNMNTLNDTLVKLSCLVGIEGAPLHFNLFPRFWVGIYNNQSTKKYADLLVNCQHLVDYIHVVLRDARVSLSDHSIRSFLEIYYRKVSQQLPISRLLYTISYLMHSKEDIDDLCGDLFAIRVIAQNTGIPATARKQLRGSLRALLYKRARFQEAAEKEIIASKKRKTEIPSVSESKTKVDNAKRRKDSSDAEDDNSMNGEPKDKKLKAVDEEETNDAPETLKETDKGTSTSTVKESAEVVEKKEEDSSSKVTEQSSKDITVKEKLIETENLDEGKKAATTDEDISDPPVSAAATCSSSAAPDSGSNTNNAGGNDLKKTANDRILEEQDKRLKLLLTMESYIKTILALMQKDESSSGAGTSGVNAANKNAMATRRMRMVEDEMVDDEDDDDDDIVDDEDDENDEEDEEFDEDDEEDDEEDGLRQQQRIIRGANVKMSKTEKNHATLASILKSQSRITTTSIPSPAAATPETNIASSTVGRDVTGAQKKLIKASTEISCEKNVNETVKSENANDTNNIESVSEANVAESNALVEPTTTATENVVAKANDVKMDAVNATDDNGPKTQSNTPQF